MLDCKRWWYGGQGTSQQVTEWRWDRLIPLTVLRQGAKPEDCSGRAPERDREMCHDLVLEENSLDGNGSEVPNVGRVPLGDENDGQERMISIDVSNDRQNG